MTNISHHNPIPEKEEDGISQCVLLTQVLGLGTTVIGFLGLLGFFLSVPVLTSYIPGTKPVAFSATILWMILGIILAFAAGRALSLYWRVCLTGILTVIALEGIIEFCLNLAGMHFFPEVMITQWGSTLTGMQMTPTSPITALLIIPAVSGLGIIVNLPKLLIMNPRFRNVAGVIGLIVSFISFIFILSYLYGTPFFSGTKITPITLPSALALFLIGLGLMSASGPRAVPLRYFTGTSTHARLMRAFIPLTIIIVLCEELLEIVVGFFGEVNNAVISSVIIGIFLVITIVTVSNVTRSVSSEIDRSELKRRAAEDGLRDAFERLAAQEEELRHQYDHQAENQKVLAERERQYRTILRTAMDGFCLVDLNAAFLDVNDAFCTMLGYTRDEMLALTLRDIEVKESEEIIAVHMQRIMQNGSDRFETRYRCKDGRIIDAEVSVVYTGSPTAPFCTFHRDITEQNRSHGALELAKKKLNLLNVVTITDLKNAVFSLEGYTQLVKSDPGSQNLGKLVSKQEEILHRISHLLEFAHSYQDMGMRPPRWQNVNHVFLLAISHLDLSQIRHHVALDGLEIYGDPLLEQVFQILADNTLTHGEYATEISLTYVRKSDSLIILYQDNGRGIPTAVKRDIFNRDYLSRKGTGLFLVREILEITGMSISETGEPDAGVRFEITVPKEFWREGSSLPSGQEKI
jgi:PAS domain S-box-containing protein